MKKYRKRSITAHNISLNTIFQTCYVATTILQYFFEKIKEETILKINYKLKNYSDVRV
jgi:hypothetical protein